VRLRSNAPGPLRHRDFRLVYISATISVIGDRFAFVAIPFAIIAADGSPGDIGLIVAAETAARGAFLLFGGVMADRLRRARVMVGADLVRAACQAALAALIITGEATLPTLVALQALHGAASAFFDPASTGLVAEVVPSDELQPANAQLSFSPGVALAVDAATFVVSAGFLLGVSTRERARDEHEPQERMLHDLRVGFRELIVRPWLMIAMGASGVSLTAVLATLFVLGPLVASESLGGADAWGIAVGALGLGSVLGGIVALRVPARRQIRSIFSVALITVPGILLLAVPAPIAILAVAMFASGIAMTYAGTVYEVVLQQWVPPAVLARVASYDWLVTTVLSSLGLVLAGRFAEAVGLEETLIASAVIVTVAATIPLASRAVRRADALHAGSKPAEEAEPVLVLPDPPRAPDMVVLPDPPQVWANRE
jgi:hypothetical protein